MKVNYKSDSNIIEVWLTNKEQEHCDRHLLTAKLLKRVNNPKCKVIFFLSGSDDLYMNMEGLLISNLLKCLSNTNSA